MIFEYIVNLQLKPFEDISKKEELFNVKGRRFSVAGSFLVHMRTHVDLFVVKLS